MPKVTYRNIFEDNSEFVSIESNSLIGAVYEFAKQSSDEIYESIIQEKIAIFLNGKPVEVDKWHSQKVESDDEIVVISRLEGGKNIFGFLMIAAGIALMAFAPAIAAAMPAAWGVTAGQIALTGLSLTLSGFARLIFSPDLPSLPEGGSKETQTYNWSGIKTTAKSDTPIPIKYGTGAVGGNIISAYTEQVGNDNYLNMLIALCEGEIEGICQEKDYTQVCVTSDRSNSNYEHPAIFINDQPLRNYDNIEWWYRTGTNKPDASYDSYYPFVQNPIPHLNQARVQINDGRVINSDWIEYTTQKAVDAVTLNVRADALFDAGGKVVEPVTVNYEIQFKEVNESSWHQYQIDRWSAQASTEYVAVSYTDGRYKFDYPRDSIYLKIVKMYFNRDLLESEEVESPWQVGVQIFDKNWNYIEYKEVYLYEYFTTGDYKIQFQSGIVNGLVITIYSGYDPQTVMSITGKSKTPITNSHVLDFTKLSGASGTAVYNIRIRRYGSSSSSLTRSDQIVLYSIVETIYGDFIYPNVALLGFRIKATGQLSGGIPSVKAIVKGLLVDVPNHSGSEKFDELFYNDTLDRFETVDGVERTWDGSTYTKEYSENAMLCVRDLLLNTRYGLGKYINETDLYSNSIIEAIKFCHAKWSPSQLDYFSWYNDGLNSNWGTYWSFVEGDGTSDSVNRTITSDGNSKAYSISIKSSASISQGIEHTFSVNISSINETSNIYLYGDDGRESLKIELGSALSVTAGTHTISFTPNISGLKRFYLNIQNSNLESGNNVTFTISNLELKNSTTSYEHLHTVNGIIDSRQSAISALFEICDSFRCWPIWLNGKFSFVIDKDDTPVHLLSMGDIEEFSQSFTPISEIPYKLYGQYIDKDINYQMRALVARTTDTTIPKAREKTIGFKWLIDRKRVERELKFKLNKLTNTTHMVRIRCGLDKLHATAGDIILVQHQLPQWGEGGRILSYSGNDIVLDRGFTFDDVSSQYLIRYSTLDNSFVTATVDLTGIANGDTRQNISVLSANASPIDNGIYAIGKYGSIKPFRIVSAIRSKENKVEINAIEHLSSLYSEDSIVVIRDNYSDLDAGEFNIYKKPSPPTEFIVKQTNMADGIGFEFYVEIEPFQNIKDVVVEWSTNPYDSFQTLLVLGANQKTAKYINSSLQLDKEYYFRAYCRTDHKSSDMAFAELTLSPDNYKPDPPTGIYIKGKDPNSTTFSDKDITIEWKPVGATYSLTGPLSGYVVEVYHDSVNPNNLLRTSFVKDEKFIYTFDNNFSDSNGNPHSVLVFVLYSRIGNGVMSDGSVPLKVINESPSTLQNVRATSVVGGVRFDWDNSNENDHKNYTYRFKVGTGTYYGWYTNSENSVVYALTATDIDNYSNTTNVKIFVKDVDYFGQQSSIAASAEASANLVSSNIFRLIATSSVSGSLELLYDGNTDSGGVTV